MSKKKRKNPPQSLRMEVFVRDGFKCYRCGVEVGAGRKRSRKGKPLATVDHLIPRSKGGPHHLINLKTCCKRCNEKRKNKLPDNWQEILKEIQNEQTHPCN